MKPGWLGSIGLLTVMAGVFALWVNLGTTMRGWPGAILIFLMLFAIQFLGRFEIER